MAVLVHGSREGNGTPVQEKGKHIPQIDEEFAASSNMNDSK